jgi:hypothetical protein
MMTFRRHSSSCRKVIHGNAGEKMSVKNDILTKNVGIAAMSFPAVVAKWSTNITQMSKNVVKAMTFDDISAVVAKWYKHYTEMSKKCRVKNDIPIPEKWQKSDAKSLTRVIYQETTRF